MPWFGYMQNKRDAGEVVDRNHQNVSSSTEWEVLSQADHKAQGVERTSEDTSDTGCGSLSDDETLTVIEGEDELLKQVEALKAQIQGSHRENQSLEERLRREQNDLGALKEKSKQAVIRMGSELDEAYQEARNSQKKVDAITKEMAKVKDEMRSVAEEAHQAQIQARLEMKARRTALEEKSQKLTKAERENDTLKEEIKAAREELAKLTVQLGSLKSDLARSQERNEMLKEQSRSLEKGSLLLKTESSRIRTQNSQILAMLGFRSLEQAGSDALATKPDLVSDAEVAKMLEALNSEIFEAAAYIADSFEFDPKPFNTTEVKEACPRVNKMLGPMMVQNLTSIRHDEDPVIVQIACQACMIECSRRIILSWCFDGSKAEQFLPELYGRIRTAETQAGSVSGRWRALTRTLVRSMLHGQSDILSRLIPLMTDTLADALLVAGCEGTRTETTESLTTRFRQKMTNIATLALRLNEVIGEQITSCDMKAVSMPHGIAFMPRIMIDGFEEGRVPGELVSETPRVLCTTELGLQKGIEGDKAAWQTVVKPKVALESLTDGLQRRD